MTGGLLILINSKYNNYLITNPEISFFKAVYRKYTNFSIESITESIDKKGLSKTENTTILYDIPRHADLLNGIYFNFTLPSIYSGIKENTSYTYNFKWIKNIGTNLIKSASIIIDGHKIDTLYSEWLNIYYELYLSNEEKKVFDKMTGNVKELYEPEYGEGQNGQYPHISSGNQYDKYNASGFNIIDIGSSSANINTTTPSIVGKKYRVKLPFWFSTKNNLALPLLAIQYSKIQIELTLAPIYDLYTVIDVNTSNTNSFGKRVKCNTSNDSTLGIQNFILDTSIVSTDGSTRTLTNLDLDMSLELDYVFLDDSDRSRFCLYAHEYLIEHHTYLENNVSDNSNSSSTSTIFVDNLVKYLVFIPKRSDAKNINDWNNYTAWQYENTPPYSADYLELDSYYDLSNSREPFYTINNSDHETDFKIGNLKQEIISGAKIQFNGNDIIRKYKDNIFYEHHQTYNYFKKNNKRGIYVYSFSLDPLDYQPSGACNFSNVGDVDLLLNYNIPNLTGSNSLTFDVNIHVVSYNILSIKSGCAGLKYAL
tara:strand:+ start:13997 stop:15610 length:1614 start_codon:yes stop_codon:yes gene_type:complete